MLGRDCEVIISISIASCSCIIGKMSEPTWAPSVPCKTNSRAYLVLFIPSGVSTPSNLIKGLSSSQNSLHFSFLTFVPTLFFFYTLIINQKQRINYKKILEISFYKGFCIALSAFNKKLSIRWQSNL